jgi:hypothetical protein
VLAVCRMSEHPRVEHYDQCRDKTVRQSDVPFQRGLLRLRCLGCGAQTIVPKVVTQ